MYESLFEWIHELTISFILCVWFIAGNARSRRKCETRSSRRKVKREAEEKAKQEAEEKKKQDAEEKAKQEAAEEKAKREAAEEKAKQEAAEEKKKAKQEAEEKAKQEAEEKAKREAAEEKAKRVAVEEKAKREAAEDKAKQEAEVRRVVEDCALIGCPLGSKWCWTSSNDDIAAGEVGTVVGIELENDKRVMVKFSKGNWFISKDYLITYEVWQERQAVRL